MCERIKKIGHNFKIINTHFKMKKTAFSKTFILKNLQNFYIACVRNFFENYYRKIGFIVSLSHLIVNAQHTITDRKIQFVYETKN